AEIDRGHLMTPVLASLRRMPECEFVALEGLTADNLREMLDVIGAEAPPEPLVQAVQSETSGNPFFVRELLLYLKESGKILNEGQSWLTKLSVEELEIPEGIRELVGQRLSRLSDEANRLLIVASAFKGSCLFSVAASVSGLDEDTALGALD